MATGVMAASKDRFTPIHSLKQRGVVLFFALIALVVMSLAAVALIRSVDTSTLIAGNLAFKQSATSTGDTGAEAAINWLSATQLANTALDVYTIASHPLNVTTAANGYYSNADPALSLTNGTGIQWTNADSASAGTDGNGNTIRYVIQRMCRTANRLLYKLEEPVNNRTGCLFSDPPDTTGDAGIVTYDGACVPPAPPAINGCPIEGQSPQYRITARILSQKGTASYIQAFVF